MKLPTINMNSFYGEPGNWHTFTDSFDYATDENDTLPNIQKMNYLNNLVEGKATIVISVIKLPMKIITSV